MYNRLVFFCAVLFCLHSAAALPSPAQAVTASLESTALARGTTVKGTVMISLPEGLHVNSNKPSSEYAIATSVKISGDGLAFGVIRYPEGKMKKFQFSREELSVYEGDVPIRFSVRVPRNYRRKTATIRALVTYQACTDEVCYPPKDVELVLSATVN